nr:DUF305 domain-containing protein [Rhodococcus sp. (in: high G+C Gram-positive bacteria)]
MPDHSRSTRLLLAAIGTTALVLTASCSNDGALRDQEATSLDSPSATAEFNDTEFNDTDVMFAQMMYPHHEQAVQMARLVNTRTTTATVVDLAARIAAAQQPEMDRLANLLESWGATLPDSSTMNHGSGGMMSDADMESLTAATGSDFDRQWLTMMIDHHSGAIEMARTELDAGVDVDARDLASSIATDQQQEIDTMRAMLGR